MSNCSVSRRNRQQRPGDSGYAQILRTLLFLSIPTIVEEVLATLLQYVDTAMVGQLGEQATASVSITTNVTWLVNSAAGAVGTAICTVLGAGASRGLVLYDRGQCVQGSSFCSPVPDKTQPGETMAWPFLNLIDKRLPENLKKFFHRF